MPITVTLDSILSKDTSVLCSDRFEIQEFIDRGAWGSVYKAKDLETNETVAIKVCDPNDLGKRLMLTRHLDEDGVMRKELLRRGSSGPNIVPREFYRDKNGKPFIVMPYFAKFLSDEIEIRKKNPPPAHWGTPLPTGFTVQEVLGYIKDIVKGVAHIHKRYKRAHCDLKPENIAMDSENTPQISDFGTSTYVASKRPHAGQRGHFYIMSPSLLKGDANPKLSCDVFSIGSLLFRLFTGKFIFEDEIDEALKTEDGLDNLADRFIEKSEHGYTAHRGTFQELIRQKIAARKIPAGIDNFILSCICEGYYDGTDMSHNLERAIDEYHKAEGKKAATAEVKSKLYTKFLEGALTAAFFVGVFVTSAWGIYFSKPDFSTKTDIETQAVVRPVVRSDLVFEAEKRRPYAMVENKYYGLDNLMKHHQERFHDKTLIDQFVTAWIEAASEVSTDLAFDGMRHRYTAVFRRPPMYLADDQGIQVYASDYLREYLPHALRSTALDETTIDLEDAVVWVLQGPDDLRKAIKVSNNTQYEIYKNAKRADGSLIISSQAQQFVDKFCSIAAKRFPSHIRYK